MPGRSVLSVTSHVCYGHVGAQASVLALQRLGHEVWHLPTVILSNHPGHGGFGGGPVKLARLEDLAVNLVGRGLVDDCAAVHSGYLGQGAAAATVLRLLDQLRGRGGGALYLCDPVMGDGERVYVGEDVVTAIRDLLLPLADVATPNRLELELLTGEPVRDAGEALAACRTLQARGPARVVCTSAEIADGTLVLVGLDGAEGFRLQLPYLDGAPFGTGDAFAAILLGRLLQGLALRPAVELAAAAVQGLIRASLESGASELAVVAGQDEITQPSRRFPAEPFG